MYISKNQLVNRIRRAAKKYKNHLVGKTFLFVYENKYIEVMFTTKAFFHLTGVNSKLSAIDFYRHSITENGLRASEIIRTQKTPLPKRDKVFFTAPPCLAGHGIN